MSDLDRHNEPDDDELDELEPPQRRRTAREYAAAIRKHAAIISLVAEELGVSVQAVHQRINTNPPLQRVVQEVEDRKLDLGEGQIVKAMGAGDMTTVRWYMDRKGQARGYGNRTRVSLDDRTLGAVIDGLSGDPDALRGLVGRLDQEP